MSPLDDRLVILAGTIGGVGEIECMHRPSDHK
jgi:hypothetical protein